jgi:hypothetical protein
MKDIIYVWFPVQKAERVTRLQDGIGEALRLMKEKVLTQNKTWAITTGRYTTWAITIVLSVVDFASDTVTSLASVFFRNNIILIENCKSGMRFQKIAEIGVMLKLRV